MSGPLQPSWLAPSSFPQIYGPVRIPEASQTPLPLNTPFVVVGSQQGVAAPVQSLDVWQVTAQAWFPAVSFTHSAPAEQQVEPQDCAAGQHASAMHWSPEAQQVPLQRAAAQEPPLVVPLDEPLLLLPVVPPLPLPFDPAVDVNPVVPPDELLQATSAMASDESKAFIFEFPLYP